jgi:hypothetical protein
MMKATIITKKREGAISEMEKLLLIWMEDQAQKHVPLSMQLFQAKAKSLFEDIKAKYPGGTQTFSASRGWSQCFRNRAGFHNVKVSGEAASGDAEAAQQYPEWLKKSSTKGPIFRNKFSALMRLAFSSTKCHLGRTFQRRKRPCPGTKLPRRGSHFCWGGMHPERTR